MSAKRSKVALVDEAGGVHIYVLAEDGGMGRLLWSGEGATSLAWNAALDGALTYSGGGRLCTKFGDGAVQQQEQEVTGTPAAI